MSNRSRLRAAGVNEAVPDVTGESRAAVRGQIAISAITEPPRRPPPYIGSSRWSCRDGQLLDWGAVNE